MGGDKWSGTVFNVISMWQKSTMQVNKKCDKCMQADQCEGIKCILPPSALWEIARREIENRRRLHWVDIFNARRWCCHNSGHIYRRCHKHISLSNMWPWLTRRLLYSHWTMRGGVCCRHSALTRKLRQRKRSIHTVKLLLIPRVPNKEYSIDSSDLFLSLCVLAFSAND